MSETHREFHGLHVRFAESLCAQFERLWQRPLAPHERTIVSSYVTCVGFMLLEAVERELAHATSEGDAAGHFAHMEKEVGREGQRVLERMAAAAHVDSALLARESGGDLLRAEECVVRLLGRELP